MDICVQALNSIQEDDLDPKFDTVIARQEETGSMYINLGTFCLPSRTLISHRYLLSHAAISQQPAFAAWLVFMVSLSLVLPYCPTSAEC